MTRAVDLEAAGRRPVPDEPVRDGVSPDYRHGSKVVGRGEPLTLGEAVVKWYDLAPAAEPVDPEVRERARWALVATARAGALDLGGGLGFALLHRCGERSYLLLVCTWRNDNELWETVWATEDAREFRPLAGRGSHRPTFCVWELGVVCYEQRAWARYLRSRRDDWARQAYLRTAYEGAV